MTLDIFTHRFGDEPVPALDNENRGLVARQMLDCIQTVVDVIGEDGPGFAVRFSETMSAYTDQQKRQIVISGMPLVLAKPGTKLTEVAAVLTGLAVHEVGHTRQVGIIDAVRDAYPGKLIPKTLGNIIEDVVLEARTIEHYAGFRDIFVPTLGWVAEQTCPKDTLVWGGSTGHKVNLVGQIVRYRPFVTFGDDAVTVAELRWWDEWSARITASLTPKGGLAMVREALAHLAAQREETPEPPVPPVIEPPEPPVIEEPPEGGCKFPIPGGDEPKGKGKGEGEGQSLPDEEDDDDDTEGDEPGGDGDGDDSDEEGGSEGSGDSDEDGDGEGGTEGEDGEDDGDGEGNPDPDGDERTGTEGDKRGDPSAEQNELEQGSNDGEGSGGTGQGWAEAGDDDPDAGLEPGEIDKSFDDVAHTENRYQDSVLQNAADEEARTTRVNAGKYGEMRVVWE